MFAGITHVLETAAMGMHAAMLMDKGYLDKSDNRGQMYIRKTREGPAESI